MTPIDSLKKLAERYAAHMNKYIINEIDYVDQTLQNQYQQAANPQAILALIEEIENLRAALAKGKE